MNTTIMTPYGQLKNPAEYRFISFLMNKYHTLGPKKEFYALFDKPTVPNPHCAPGESLREKTKSCRDTIKEYIKKYGVYYKDKETYKKQKDPFRGKLFAVYYDRANHRLCFIFNPEAFEKFCENLEIQLISALEAPHPEDSRSYKYINIININNKLNTTTNEVQWDPEKEEEDKIKAGKMLKIWGKIIGPFGPIWAKTSWLCDVLKEFFQDSLEKWEAYCRKIASNDSWMGRGIKKFQAWLGWALKKENIEMVMNTEPQAPLPMFDAEDEKLLAGMEKIFKEKVGDTGVNSLNQSLKERMLFSLRTKFEGCLLKWEGFCGKIATSKFLMGEVPNARFKIWLPRAIKPEVVERIEAGEYGTDRTPPVHESKEEREQKATEKYLELQEEIERKEWSEDEKSVALRLLEHLGVPTYDSWFRKLNAIRREKDKTIFYAPNRWWRGRIKDNYGAAIKEILGMDVEFE